MVFQKKKKKGGTEEENKHNWILSLARDPKSSYIRRMQNLLLTSPVST